MGEIFLLFSLGIALAFLIGKEECDRIREDLKGLEESNFWLSKAKQ